MSNTRATELLQQLNSLTKMCKDLGIDITRGNEEKQQLVPAFYAAMPKTVKYAKSLKDFSNKEYQELPVEKFAAENGFEWTESMLIPAEFRAKIWSTPEISKTAGTKVEERLHAPLEDLVIVHINDQVGKGVFLASDAKPIPAGTIVNIYAGKIIESSHQVVLLNYSMESNCDEHKASGIHRFIRSPGIDAEKYGNITRFMQDLPSMSDMDNLEASNLVKSNIAAESLLVWPTIIFGIPINFLITPREIKPGEQLGFSYGDGGHYFTRRSIKRCIFNKLGEVIGHVNNKKVVFKDYHPSAAMAFPQINEEELRAVGLELMQLSMEAFDYRKRFAKNVQCGFEAYIKSTAPGSEDREWGETLLASFQKQLKISCDEGYKVVYNAFKDKDVKSESLTLFKKELVFHMNNYNKGKKKLSKVETPAKPSLGFSNR